MKYTKLITNYNKILLAVGLIFVLVSFTLIALIFKDILKSEVKYYTNQDSSSRLVVADIGEKKDVIVAADKNFSVVIPKIGANAKVIENVDAFDPKQYQVALTKGVAMASKSAFPLMGKNTFIFAHSSDNFINANNYNAVFYLLYKLDVDDKVYIVYRGKVLEYKVVEKSYVDSTSTSYMSADFGENTVTLMTCWPPGTTLKRLIIVAKLENT